MRRSFSGNERALLTVMVQAQTPERVRQLVDLSIPEGADAFGMQFELFKPEYRREDIFRGLFRYTGTGRSM